MQKSILLIVGTRPEGIKMMPIFFELKKKKIPVLLVTTGQHTDLLQDVFDAFGVRPDIDLALGKPNQDLAYLTQAVLNACTTLYATKDPALVVLQGDTTTVMAAGLAAFYKNIPVLHVEAGLRTGDIMQPYPEEFNRRQLSLIAAYHCAPTALAVAHLLAEGVAREKVFCTGNTVVDALHLMQARLEAGTVAVDATVRERVEQARTAGKKIVLLTAHRRESFDGGLSRIFSAVTQLNAQYQDLFFIYPTHPNPQVQQAFKKSSLMSRPNFFVVEPLSYQDLVYVLLATDIVMTDSGGIQEEAVSLGKPTLVLREKTERAEGVWEGIAQLVGTHEEKIVEGFVRVYAQAAFHQTSAVYGDGRAAQRIVKIMATFLDEPLMTVEKTKKIAEGVLS